MLEWGFGLLIGVVLAGLTSTVGVSGAVFLLPVQLDVFKVPSLSVTPTNLLFNVVSVPGALLGYRRTSPLLTPLARQMILGTLPGVVAGAAFRVFVAPGPGVAKGIAAFVLIPVAISILMDPRQRHEPSRYLSWAHRHVTSLALAVGFIGGIYGVGGGSLLAPLLVAAGMQIAVVAPAALLSTFVTSIVGAGTYVVLSNFSTDTVTPEWGLGLACGLGGLLGGYLGSRVQPRVPRTLVRVLLGVVALVLGLLYAAQAVS